MIQHRWRVALAGLLAAATLGATTPAYAGHTDRCERKLERIERDFARFMLPLLILHGTADKVTRPDGSQLFYDKAGSSDKTLKLYDGHYHDLLNDIGREAVVADILAWIDKHLPAA